MSLDNRAGVVSGQRTTYRRRAARTPAALTLCGTRATFVNGPYGAWLHTSRDPQVTPRPITTPHPGTGKGALIRQFVDSILHAVPPPLTIDEVFSSLSVGLAVDRALREGGTVRVKYL